MRGIVVTVAAVVALSGCARLQYAGSEAQMQQIARGAAELMKKDPYSDTVAAAGTGVHTALTMVMGQPAAPTEPEPVLTTLPASAMRAARLNVEPASSDTQAGADFTGLPPEFWKSTSIGKD